MPDACGSAEIGRVRADVAFAARGMMEVGIVWEKLAVRFPRSVQMLCRLRENKYLRTRYSESVKYIDAWSDELPGSRRPSSFNDTSAGCRQRKAVECCGLGPNRLASQNAPRAGRRDESDQQRLRAASYERVCTSACVPLAERNDGGFCDAALFERWGGAACRRFVPGSM